MLQFEKKKKKKKKKGVNTCCFLTIPVKICPK